MQRQRLVTLARVDPAARGQGRGCLPMTTAPRNAADVQTGACPSGTFNFPKLKGIFCHKGCRPRSLRPHPSKVFRRASQASAQSSVCNACRHRASPLRSLNLAPIRASSARGECSNHLQQQAQVRTEVHRAKSLHEQQRQTAVFGDCCQKTDPRSRVDHPPRDESLHNTPTDQARALRRLEGRPE